MGNGDRTRAVLRREIIITKKPLSHSLVFPSQTLTRVEIRLGCKQSGRGATPIEVAGATQPRKSHLIPPSLPNRPLHRGCRATYYVSSHNINKRLPIPSRRIRDIPGPIRRDASHRVAAVSRDCATKRMDEMDAAGTCRPMNRRTKSKASTLHRQRIAPTTKKRRNGSRRTRVSFRT